MCLVEAAFEKVRESLNFQLLDFKPSPPQAGTGQNSRKGKAKGINWRSLNVIDPFGIVTVLNRPLRPLRLRVGRRRDGADSRNISCVTSEMLPKSSAMMARRARGK